MKKLMVLPFVFLVSIPVLAQAKALFAGNLSETERSGAYVKFVGVDVSLPAHNLLCAKERGHLNRGQTFLSPTFPQLSNRTYLLKVTDVESKEQKGEKPPLSGGRIAGEILAGGVGGFVGMWPGFYAGWALEEALFHKCVRLCSIGFCTGWTLGSAIGVYLVGNIGNETGSFLATWGGSILGVGVWIGSSFAGLAILAPLIGATIGFNMTRRYRLPTASGTGLINFRDGQTSLAVPIVYFRPNSFDRRDLSQNIDLVRVDF